MPPAKRQKKTRNSDVSQADSPKSGADSSKTNMNDRETLGEISGNDGVNHQSPNQSEKDKSDDTKADPKPHDYICIHRPFFDAKNEGFRGKEMETDDIVDEIYQPGFDAEKKRGIFKAPPSEHKDHKWIMMWDAFLKDDLLGRKAKYCDPDNFDAYQRIAENDDADGSKELTGLLGCALLTALSAIDQAGELKPDSRFLDLALVISEYLDASHDLPDYGIEGECVAWRKEAVVLFKKGKLDPKKALWGTAGLLKKLESPSNWSTDEMDDNSGEEEDKENQKTSSGKKRKRETQSKVKEEKDPWQWDKKFKACKKKAGKTFGGEKYDITKFTRAERAREAFDGKDPLADLPIQALKDNLLDC
ncbi:hypothetical protein N0V83_006034 [Neocucurbitaria cava]|uniref:Uncharacterized protein n=1 Tax=Neocucurbitaria cava TaxID=798079 RepID=A0A9W8Y6K2_9PLEO|nr:hypothetical protein N0V83_006034 [Neocucurbitaria cava]